MIEKIVSGGQTGIDRAGLDVAMELGIPHGGWCPRGRRAEDGPIAEVYQLRETPDADYVQRTEWNVRDSDGTLVLACGNPTGGTALTVELAARHARPCLVIDLLSDLAPGEVRDWLRGNGIRILNIAGPRASGCPDGYRRAVDFLRLMLEH